MSTSAGRQASDRELQAAGEAAGEALARGVGIVRGVHAAVAGRTFGILGPVAAPVRMSHDLIAGATYGAVATAHRVAPRLAATVLALGRRDEARLLSGSPAGEVALGVVNGAHGDALDRVASPLALPMTLRCGGADVDPAPAPLASAFPDATGRLVVFVHGLCETDRSWLGAAGAVDGERASYGQALQEDLGVTPVYLRYNSGLHISDNGRRLAALLSRVVEAWPCPVERIALVGHSMGGLVARSACHQGAASGLAWAPLVSQVVCLGTPHLGSPVEKGANVIGWTLDRFPETRPFAGALNSRSVGIKDLRFGSCLETDWRDHDPDELLRDRCQEVPFLPTATYHFVGVTVTRDADHPLGALVGDLLVRFGSASGRGRQRAVPFEDHNGRHLGGLHHLQLLAHPAVYDQLRAWLER